MLRLGYFSHTNFGPTETFIYDLVKSLNNDKNISMTYVTGCKCPLIVDFNLNSIHTGYSDSYKKMSAFLYKIGQLKSDYGCKMRMSFQKKIAYRFLSKSNLPVFDVAYVDYATSAVLLMDYFEKKNIPFVVHVHGYDVTSCLNDNEYSKQIYILFNKASHLIAPSNHLRRLLVVLGCDPHKITVVYPITNVDTITIPSWIERLKNKPSLTFLGRLTAKKNPLALIHAFNLVAKKCQDVTLNILGDGELKEPLIQLVEKLGLLERVNIVGAVNRKQAFNYLKNTWVYVQHSVTSSTGDQEGFPVSLAEAAAHALPLVSTIHSGITENVINNETGFLVQEYDYETMAEKIIYLIQNPDIAEKMGIAARNHIMNICKSNDRTLKIKGILLSVVY